MTRRRLATYFIVFTTVVAVLPLTSGCDEGSNQRQVVVYTSVDRVFSEPIFREFEERTGIKVLPVYDVEAAKTTGLVNRLIAEATKPKADVFWNFEYAQTITLKEKGILAAYKSPSAEDVPPQFRDPEYFWTGSGARARVIIVNTNLVPEEDYPRSIHDLADPAWKNEVGIARPLFGTTATHAAALFVYLGDEGAKTYFRSLLDNGVRIVDGNSVVRDMVVSGALKCGLTDTDDAFVAIEKGEPVAMVFPDQDGIGTLLMPSTVCMIKGAPHPEEAKQLIDYLLSREVEEALANASARMLPLRDGVATPGNMPSFDELRSMEVFPEDIAGKMGTSSLWLQDNFYR